jgi:hypothetical protein
MDSDSGKKLFTITASDVANYVVCPEAWRLKMGGHGHKIQNTRVAEVGKLRDQWVKDQDLSTKLRYYTKIAYALLVAVVIVVFILDKRIIGRQRKPTKPPAVEAPAQP